jgi:hypothetical protein
MTQEPSQPAAQPLVASMMQGIHRAQAVHVVARLGIADLLAKGPLTLDELAEASQSRFPELNRIMRFLAGEGIFTQDALGRYELNEAAQLLRSDVPNSLRPMALYLGAPHIWAAWGRLFDSVAFGTVAFEAAHGMQRWAYEAAHPNDYALFQRFQSAAAGRRSPAAYDFSGMTTVVDVGGGAGTMLIGVLEAYPDLCGVLFDVPEVIERARAVVAQAGMTERCELVEGSFFDAVPPGGDAYILSNILHDWPDAECIRILRTCRDAMRIGARLIVVEGVVPSDNAAPSAVRYGDLQMMALTGGMQRTLEEFEALFTPTRFGGARTLHFGSNTIVEATAI